MVRFFASLKDKLARILKRKKSRNEEVLAQMKQIIKDLNKQVQELQKEIIKLQQKKIYKVKEKNVLFFIKLLVFASIIVPTLIVIVALLFFSAPLLLVAMLVPSIFLAAALFFIVFYVPLVKDILSYAFTNKKLVLVIDPERKRVKLRAWVEKDGYLFNEKLVPILIDKDSIYTIAKGHNVYLYLEGMTKTLKFSQIPLETVDEAEGRRIIYTQMPAITLTTSDVEKIIKRLKIMLTSDELQELAKKKGINIGGFNLSMGTIVLIMIIILIAVGGFMLLKNI